MNPLSLKSARSMLLPALFTVFAVMLPGSMAQAPGASNSVAAPVFTSFTPIHGAPGTTVLITGNHLANASAVKFGVGGWDGKNAGVPAFSFQAVSDTQIVAVLPPRSYWGYIQVTTPGGTADSSSVTPVNYFWPDNLQVASGAGGPMLPIGESQGPEPRQPMTASRRYESLPTAPGSAPGTPGATGAPGAPGTPGAAVPRPYGQRPGRNVEQPLEYRLFLNEYNSDAPFVIDSDLGADFRISVSGVNTKVNWVRRQNGVGAYPALFTGKHWQQGAPDGTKGLPILLSAIRGGGVLTSTFTADLSQVQQGGMWDSAWDMFLSTTPEGRNSYEIMVWLHRVNCQPIGGHVQATVTIDGQNFDVWQGGHTVSYIANPLKEGPDATLNIDVGKIMDDSIKRGFFPETWYLTDIEAGFEIWNGNTANLVAKHFDVTYHGPATASSAEAK